MESKIYQEEPNLIAETYRNYDVCEIPRRIERHFDFIDISCDGLLLLGTSNLCGRIWSGSVWVFEEYPENLDEEHCIAGIEFDSSIACGLWLNNGKNIVVGCDSGSLYHLSLTENISKLEERKKGYFTTEGVVTEHDDSILTLDQMKKKVKIVSGSMDMSIKIWDTEALACEKSYYPAHGHIVTSVSTFGDSPDSFISTSLDGTSLIWDVRLEKPASLLMKNGSGFTASAWLYQNCVSVGSNDGSVSLVDLRMKAEFDRNFVAKRPIFKLKYHEPSNSLAVCADDPFVRAFSCKDNLLLKVYESDEHKDIVRGLAWELSQQTLYSCGWDSKVFFHPSSNFKPEKLNEKEYLVEKY